MSELFSCNPDVNKNAYLNWRTQQENPAHNLHTLALDYAYGATVLINTILENNRDKKADALIMPILYSIDQSIELYIKAILRLIEELPGGEISIYKKHDIDELKRQMVAKIKNKNSKTKDLENHLRPVTEFIEELYAKIKIIDDNGKSKVNIDFARYPFSTDGTTHFYIEAKDNVVIDVENLGRRFSDIQDSLEAIYVWYEKEKEYLELQEFEKNNA